MINISENEMVIAFTGNNYKEASQVSNVLLKNVLNFSLSKGDKVAFVDLDGTLRGGTERLHLLPSREDFLNEKEDPNGLFEKFNKSCGVDKPLWTNIEYVQYLKYELGYSIFLLTSCTAYVESVEATIDQMEEWEVPFDGLIMRSPNNQRDAIEMKVGFIKEFIHNDNIDKDILIFDDNIETIKALEGIGIEFCIKAEGTDGFNHGNDYNNVSSK